jgi:hypothetical protein
MEDLPSYRGCYNNPSDLLQWMEEFEENSKVSEVLSLESPFYALYNLLRLRLQGVGRR